MMENKLQVGIIGLGHQSLEDHIPAVKASPDINLAGVVEIDDKKLKTFLSENKGVKGYKKLDDLFKNHDLDFIIVAVPHYLHYEILKESIGRKIHILKEKPFAVSLEQAKELSRLAQANNVQIMVTLQRRFNPIYSTFFQLIDKIGTPFFIEAKYTFFTDSPHEGWRGKKTLAGGGCLIDMGYHIIDLLIWYFGLPDKVFAEMSCAAKENIEYDAEDTAKVVFKYEAKKIFGSLLVSRVILPKQEYINVFGTRGIIHIERGKIERLSPNGELQESLKRDHHWPSAAQDQLEYFVKVIRGEKENIGSPEFHFNHLAFVEAAYESKRKSQYIDPKILLK